MSCGLELDHLSVAAIRPDGTRVGLLDDLSLTVAAGGMTALVGESGSGKTIAALATIGLLPRNARASGQVMLDGTDLLELGETAMQKVRGRDIGMVFQNPLAALNPSMRVGRQIGEVVRLHTGAGPAAARARARDLFEDVGIPDAADRLDDFPHQFSGGMRQRAMIAMALACRPKLLIADEPTTGLDTVVARQILALIARLCREHRMGVLFITHDLSIVEAHAERIHVLYAGRAVEWGAAAAFFAGPRHPYSQALLGAVPRLGQARLATIPGTMPDPADRPDGCRFAPRCTFREAACESAMPAPDTLGTTMFACRRGREALGPTAAAAADVPASTPAGPIILEVEGVGVSYARAARGALDALFRRQREMRALSDVSFTLRRGECLGVVGASGSGKSSLGRAILQMIDYDGSVRLDGLELGTLPAPALRAARQRIQVVFQDPRESMNPRMRIVEIVAEPLRLAGVRDAATRRDRAAELLARVGLDPRLLDRLPENVSGGEAQRVAIARALAARPDIIVLDEPTSSLDVSTQALLLNLLRDLARREGLGYILISHDIAAVFHMAERIVVLHQGRMVEFGFAKDLLSRPTNDYTRTLIASAPPACSFGRNEETTAASADNDKIEEHRL